MDNWMSAIEIENIKDDGVAIKILQFLTENYSKIKTDKL
jgi:hypothetical protein